MRYIIKKYVRKVIARSSRCFTMLLRTYFGAALLNNLTFRFEPHQPTTDVAQYTKNCNKNFTPNYGIGTYHEFPLI